MICRALVLGTRDFHKLVRIFLAPIPLPQFFAVKCRTLMLGQNYFATWNIKLRFLRFVQQSDKNESRQCDRFDDRKEVERYFTQRKHTHSPPSSSSHTHTHTPAVTTGRSISMHHFYLLRFCNQFFVHEDFFSFSFICHKKTFLSLLLVLFYIKNIFRTKISDEYIILKGEETNKQKLQSKPRCHLSFMHVFSA